jgi:hypothetical protein
VAIAVAFGLLGFAAALCGISLIELREPLLAMAAVVTPVCLVSAAFALSIADRIADRSP